MVADLGRLENPSTEQDVTDESTPDPKVLPQMMTYHVLIRPVKATGDIKTKSGQTIYMPDKVKQDVAYLTNVGRVLAMGPSAFQDQPGTLKFGRSSDCPKVGDYVSWAKMVGKKIMYQGINLTILNDDQILMKVNDPKAFNAMANYLGRPDYTPPTE